MRVRCERCRKTTGRGKKEEVRRRKPATALKPLPEPQCQAGHAHERRTAPPKPPVPPTGGLQIPCATQPKNKAHKAEPCQHTTARERSALFSLQFRGAPPKPLSSPPGAAQLPTGRHGQEGLPRARVSPPLPKSIANQTQRGTRGGAMPKIHTAASSAEGRERYTCWRTRALRNGALRPLCVPLPSPPGSPLARGGRTSREIASLLFQVAFSSSASYQLPRAPGGQTSACRG